MKLMQRSLHAFLIISVGVLALAGCDSGGGSEPSDLTLDQITGNWEVTPDIQNADSFSPAVDVVWYRIVRKSKFDDPPGEVPGDAYFYYVEGDCGWRIAGVANVGEDKITIDGPDGRATLELSVDNGVMTVQDDGYEDGEFTLEKIDQNAFKAANEADLIDGLSCDFKTPDSINPGGGHQL